MRRPALHRRAGLTLLELAITLAIVAVLGALAVPTLGLRMERQRLQHAAETLAGDIAETRFEAARRGQALHLLAHADAPWCWSVAVAPGCACGDPQPCQMQRVLAADFPGVRLLGDMDLRLDPGGNASLAQGATFETPHGERLRVDVSPLGRPRICAAAGAWPRLPSC